MKKQNQNYTTIPTMTLSALKSMLFSTDGSINLINIIEDLGGDDLTAINVALVHKGIKPQVDETSRWSWEYGNRFARYDLVRVSRILSTVTVKQTLFELNANGDGDLIRENGEKTFSLESWYDLTTDVNDVITKINKNRG